ncbi:hypothetical protein [Thermococcus thioreducens]|uniref:Uncharacterized protein n=1 Tax=Thermococcus thioreducens TaxID=277988 RepID=A0A0Q2QSH4_9EURY|nr:hypothetical protein [Thermococcus thioreducens]ASJ12242.1 hypothetical protein A3L14_04775 [Thermococcus thioreducens]KQH82981.1 hypothetical protein AMR53_01770 [Thermococcus thioreducens]SEV94291.1 hypothetical protein SAMN05216170_1012 [Thermococcus thioreducens]
MGDCKSVVAVFDEPWGIVLEKFREEFEFLGEKQYGNERENMEWFKFEDTRGFKLMLKGHIHFTLNTIEDWGPHDYFDIEVFSKDGVTVIDLETCMSKFDFILSSEFLKFLKKLTEIGAVLICGYIYGYERLERVFGDTNRFLLYEWSVGIVKRGKLEVIPSGVTVVKRELLDLEDGLYELIERPGRGEREYVLVKSMDGYNILVTVRESDLTDEECYQDLLEDKAWFSLHMTATVFKRVGKKIENEFLTRRAEEYFKAQTGAEPY